MGVIDHSAADGILGGMPSSVVSIVLNSFEADVRQLTRTLFEAAHAGDPSTYLKASQALADVALRLGAVELARLARAASQRPLAVPDHPLMVAGEQAIGEMRRAYRCGSPIKGDGVAASQRP